MTEVEEMTKQVDLVYKNILEKFNPAARQLISAGKAYLKALHGAMSASKVYLDAISKLARQSSQQCAWGGSADIGACLMQMVDVYKEIQAQQMNILKAFYVDLVVPLENNLDRDTKVVQSEQKKFLATHKQRSESYTKAAGIVKKQRKKHRAGKNAIDKDIKHLQSLEEEKIKLDGFVEQSLKSAITQERRRYGFVLERQCSLAKHYLAFHSKGNSLLQHHVDVWQDTAKSREELPDRIQGLFPPRSRAREPEGIYSSPMGIEDDRLSVTSQLRKARSMDASCVDLSTIETTASRPLTRARSDFHLDQSNPSPVPPVMSGAHYSMRPKSMAVPDDASRRTLARALYAYLSSGENQLSFHEGDIIALIGEKNKGWQYGENLRTQRCGWFPVAYTELLHEEDDSALGYKAVGRGVWRRWLADDPPGHAAPPEPNAAASSTGPTPASSSPSACPPAAPRAPTLPAASKPSPQAAAASRPAPDAVTVVISPTPTKEKVGTNSAAAAADASAAASAAPLPKPQPASSTAPTTQPQPHVRFSAHPVLPHPNNHFYTLPNRARSNLASKKTLIRSHGSSSEDSGTSEPKCSSSMYTFPSSTISPDLISDCPNSKDPATRGVNEKRQSITLTHPLTAAVIEK